MPLTFEDVKTNPGIKRVCDLDPDSPDFADRLLSAVRMAMRRGDWSGTVVPIYLCVRAGCVVWPSNVANVRAMAHCAGTFDLKNMWGAFLPREHNAPWRYGLHWREWRDCQPHMIADGRSPVFQNVQGDGRLVRAYYRANSDTGKTVTIFGIDNNGQELQHQDSAGTWFPGVVLTLEKPFASTSVYVRRIDRVLLDEMDQPINLYAYNASQDVLEDLAQYEPGITRPSFDRTKIQIPGFFGSGSGCCASKTGVAALVKITYPQRFRYDTDLVPIDNMEALKLLFQSIRFSEAGDRDNARSYYGDAIQELNRQLEDDNPDQQFSAVNNVFGGNTFNQQMF